MKKRIDCGLQFDLADGTVMLIVHYAGETRLDTFLASRLDPVNVGAVTIIDGEAESERELSDEVLTQPSERE
jgi:hypothetical protein